jgi:hypothetical protein
MMPIQLELRVTAGEPIYRGNDHYWSVIRDLGKNKGCFTLQQIHQRCDDEGIGRVKEFLRRLILAGIAERVSGDEPGKFRTGVYRLVKRPAPTPCLNPDGSPGRQGRVQDQIWVAIRSLKTFDVNELTIAASTDEIVMKRETVRDYVSHLEKAGYLQTLRKQSPKAPAIWRLKPSMDTGPKAPKILASKMVYDANRKEIMGKPVAVEVAA